MKLSENTIEILKNFASINQGLVVRPGNKLRTINSSKSVLAEAIVDETFEQEFGIYDLHKLLGLLSLDKQNPEIVFEKEFLVFKGLNGSGKIRQRFTETNLIVAPPNKEIPANFFTSFTLTQEIQNWIFNVASILKCPNIIIKSAGEELTIWAADVKEAFVDDANVKLEEKCDVDFEAVLKIDNFKILDGPYKVEVDKKFLKLTHLNKKLSYFISVESNSKS